jgi:hypothetical protein
MRQIVEHEIAEAVVDALLGAGYRLSTDYGDGESKVTSDRAQILKDLFQGDDDRLYAHKGGKYFGWVYLVYGNDGWDVISDYTTNLESLIGEKGTKVQKIVEKYSD